MSKPAESTKALFRVLMDGQVHTRKELVMAMVKAKRPLAKDEDYYDNYRGSNTFSIAWHSGYTYKFGFNSHPQAKMDKVSRGKYQINALGVQYANKILN